RLEPRGESAAYRSQQHHGAPVARVTGRERAAGRSPLPIGAKRLQPAGTLNRGRSPAARREGADSRNALQSNVRWLADWEVPVWRAATGGVARRPPPAALPASDNR